MGARQVLDLLTKSKRRLAQELADAQVQIAELQAGHGIQAQRGRLTDTRRTCLRHVS